MHVRATIAGIRMYRAWLQEIVDENISNDQKVLNYRKLGAEFDSSCNWGSEEEGAENHRRPQKVPSAVQSRGSSSSSSIGSSIGSSNSSSSNSNAALERPPGFAGRPEAHSSLIRDALGGEDNHERTRRPKFCFYSGESSD
jgi:hypothetical protein